MHMSRTEKNQSFEVRGFGRSGRGFAGGLIALAVLALSGCGKQAFVVVETTSLQSAPGTYTFPPKIDILLAQDDTGSMNESLPQVKQQLPAFLNNLEGRGWDYHFATTPLTHERAFHEIAASWFDSAWGALWVPPYPGAVIDLAQGITPANRVRRPETYSQFLGAGDIQNVLNGFEPGLETIERALVSHAPGTGFLRDDALLVILVLSNGNDTSDVKLCDRGDSVYVPCENAPQAQQGTAVCGTPGVAPGDCSTLAGSFDHYRSAFRAVKPDPAQVTFYSAVAKQQIGNCLGGASRYSSRYIQMAGELGGASYDICSQSVSSVLDSIAGQLQVTKGSFRTRYLFVEREPDVSSISVVRYIGGDVNQAVEIPQDPINGWTYEGYLNDVYVIDSPVEMNRASGYALELHGSAKLVGNDSAAVTFKPAGAENAAE